MIEAQGWGKEVGWRVWATQKHARRVVTQYLPPKFNSEFTPERMGAWKTKAFLLRAGHFFLRGELLKWVQLDMQMILRGSGYLRYVDSNQFSFLTL